VIAPSGASGTRASGGASGGVVGEASGEGTAAALSALEPPRGDTSAPARPSKSSQEIAAIIELKRQMALDGERESNASNVLTAYHKIGMAIISNMKC